MPTLHTLGTLKIAMFARDHEPAHVHVIDAEVEWRIVIATGAVLTAEGRLSRKQQRAVLAWIAENRAFLQSTWAALRVG